MHSATRQAERRQNQNRPSPFLKVGSDFYVLASSQASRRTVRVLTSAHNFAVFDATGDILESPLEALGFFHNDTRYLSRFEMQVAGRLPYFLNSYLSDDKAEFRANLTNPDIANYTGVVQLARNSMQIERGWTLANGALAHRVMVKNFSRARIDIALDFFYGADFADLFEVRGVPRKRHGRHLRPRIGERSVRFLYEGLDEIRRITEIQFNTPPRSISRSHAGFEFGLDPDEQGVIEVLVSGQWGTAVTGPRRKMRSFAASLASRREELESAEKSWSSISASSKMFSTMLQQSQADLTSIITHSHGATYMMAGIPWFATLFGRDSLITAMSLLPFNPAIAAGTLRSLAELQGTREDEARDEQPGKIVHETRSGEMARTGEVPFGRYYGSVDSTPLFLWLFGEYTSATGDMELAEELWPNVERALDWIETYGDRDRDGYVEYLRETPRGLANQGWKDSFDAISHRDGELARAPIALCEVQGYVYAAYMSLAEIAGRLGRDDVVERAATRAVALKQAFERDFWIERDEFAALALDAEKRPCAVMSSNAAHCLATRILDGDRARALARKLFGDDLYSGWGVRTLSTRERRYNPVSYHNGSVWPHDNGFAALGVARAGHPDGVVKILEGLFDASGALEERSLPELFCGYDRDPRLGPVPYPVACYPQAWSAASIFMILQAILGLSINGFTGRVVFESPVIPPSLQWISVKDLKVGAGSVSILLRRTPNGAAIEVVDKKGPVSVEVIK